MQTNSSNVPVLIYHSIADDHPHPWSILSLPVDVFERQIAYLRRQGFNAITLYELHLHIKYGSPLPPKPIVMTFDDGFLDNWVYAFPILKRYDMKATIFVCPEFVDPVVQCRPNLDDLQASRLSRHELAWWGYLSWPEMRMMLESGLVDIQSHSQTHTWHFTGDEVVDFHHPGDAYPWLSWNAYPENKYGWLTEQRADPVCWGTPVYRFDYGLQQRRYYPDPELADATVGHVTCNGGECFFQRSGWKEELINFVIEYRSTHQSAGRYETYEEYIQRVRSELVQSKQTIETKLKKPVDFLCWPFGAFTETTQRIAIDEAGYLATVSGESAPNRYGADPTMIGRTFFGQGYQGPCRASLVFLKFVGRVHQQRGLFAFSSLIFVINRLMGLLKFLQKFRWRRGHSTGP